MSYRFARFGFALLAIVLAVGLKHAPEKGVIVSPLIGKQAPEYAVPDLMDPADQVTSADHKGKWHLLNVWGTWCVACGEEHPVLLEIAQENRIPIVGLDWRDKDPDALEWLEQRGNPYARVGTDKDGRVMVSDFGIARALEEVSLTASGMVIGTPYYMSPEQCGGQKISPQSDQYSLGILGFQMLTGEVPFNADSMVGVIQHHYMTPVPDIRAVRNDVPQELLDIIYCSLNKAPEDRFTTTREMALKDVLRSRQK